MGKIRIAFFFIISLIICWAVTDCLAQDKIVAIVNQEVITQKDLNDFINFMRMQFSQDYAVAEVEKKIDAIKSDLLDRLIEDRLILQEAKKLKIIIDQARVKTKISEIKKHYNSEAEFQETLGGQGLVQADIENKIKEQMLMYNVIDYKIRSKILIRPEEVTAFYNNNKDDFVTPEERQLQVIALENEDLAKSFSYALRTGEKLEDLATRYPLTLNKLNVRRPSELRKDVEDLVFNLGITEVSEPVQIDDKFYVFKLDSIIPSKPISLIEAQDRINDFLFQKKMQEDLMRWLDELKKQSYIKIF